MRNPCTELMQHQADIPNLCQQILYITSTNRELAVVLTQIAAAVCAEFRADGCMIALPETHQPNSPTVYWLSHTQSALVQQLQLSPTTFNEWMKAPIVATDVDRSLVEPTDLGVERLVEVWQATELTAASLPPVRAVAGIATRFQNRVNGLISLMQFHPRHWLNHEIEGIQVVSHQVAIAIAQLQLQQHLNKQMQYQAVVNQLTLAIRNSSDLGEILKIATEDTAKALQVSRGLLLRLKYWDPLIRNRSQEQLPKIRVNVACKWFCSSESSEITSWQQFSGETLTPDTEAISSFWMSDCALCQQGFMQSTTPVIINHQQQLPIEENEAGIAPIFNLAEMPSLLLAPLESQGTVLGFLVLQHSQSRTWQPEEVELVKLVSAQVSTAIIQTETLRQVQALVEKRTAELRESLSVQAKLYERTRQQLDQLRHLNQLKDEFLSTVSHELRTPLTSMTLAIRMLRQANLSGDRSVRYLDILEQQCAQETNLINDLLALQELESKQVSIQLQEINLNQTIEELETAFNQKWSSKGLTLAVNLPCKPIRLQSDQDSLNRILFELLTNAGKYSDPNSQVRLTVSQAVDQPVHQVVLTLSNHGPCIAPAELPYIFDKFRRCQGATQNAIQGTGLGLALVKSLVQHINGTISASSCATEGMQSGETCFTLKLPQIFESFKF